MSIKTWLHDLLFWRSDYKKYEKRMWQLFRDGHDIGTLPGGFQIHYRVCWCKREQKKMTYNLTRAAKRINPVFATLLIVGLFVLWVGIQAADGPSIIVGSYVSGLSIIGLMSDLRE